MKIAVLLAAGVGLGLAACGSDSTVTKTFVLAEPGNATLEAVVTLSSQDADLFQRDLAATEPSGAAFSTKDGDQHTMPRVCESDFHTQHGAGHIAVFGGSFFPATICQELVQLGASTPSPT